MQVSLEVKDGLERHLRVQLPASKVSSAVDQRIQQAARTVRLAGFRPGKVPLTVVRQRFGEGIRQEVLGEVIRDSFFEAVQQEKLTPTAFPRIEAVDDSTEALRYTAVFEVYPEISLGELSTLSVERLSSEVSDTDVDTMLQTLRRQKAGWEPAQRPARDGDHVEIDFEGRIDGNTFDGGAGKAMRLVLGSRRMITGFEDGLIGAAPGEERVLSLVFPEAYHAPDLAGKPVAFTVRVNVVYDMKLPVMDDEFFRGFGISEGGEERFRGDVRRNMQRELKTALRNKVKASVMDALLAANEVDLPQTLITSEIQRQRENMVKQFGGNQQVDATLLPDELFTDQAKRMVGLGLIVSELVRKFDIQVDKDKVRAYIDEIAESYERPQDVVNWYTGNRDQLRNIEGLVLEDQVVDTVLSQAQVVDTPIGYQDAMRPAGEA